MPLEHPKVLAEALLQQNSVALVLVNNEREVLFANEAASELALKDPVHGTIDEQCAPQIWGNAQDFEGRIIPVNEWPIALALRGVKTVSKELRMVRPDGVHHDVSASAVPLKIEEVIIGAIASFTDITARRLAEQQLAAINRHLEEAAAERARGVHLMHRIGLTMNNVTEIRKVCQIALTEICAQLKWPVGFAYIVEAAGRLHGMTVWYSSNPERYEILRRASEGIDFSLEASVIGEVLRKNATRFIANLDSEESFLRKDAARHGGLKSYLAVPVLANKQVTAILEFFHTESIKLRDSLLEVMDVIAAYLSQIMEEKRIQKKLQALFDSAPDAQIVTDGRGKILMANTLTERLFGYDEHLLIGQPVEVLVPPDLRTQHIQHRAKYAATPQPRPMGTGVELTALCKDGTSIPVEVSLSPVELDEGLLIAAAIRDVSERKKLEAQLRENERLAEMGKMAAIFAHEAANPLQGIFSTIRLIKETISAEYLGLMNDLDIGVSHLQSLLTQFRSFSRLTDVKLGSVDLTRLVDSAVRIHRRYWSGLGIRVVTEFTRNLTLEADAERLLQVVLNLCRNAVQSMPDGGTLTVRTYSTGGDAIIEVSDTGSGIAEAAELFELFTTTKAEGAGIGLYVVKQIVSAHGGTVTYSSKQGTGTTFRISLVMEKPAASVSNPH